jgi:hypothetical protein
MVKRLVAGFSGIAIPSLGSCQTGRIEILAQRINTFRPAFGQVQAFGVAQAGDLDPEHFMQFTFENVRAGDDFAQAGHRAALARDAHPQGDHHVAGAKVIEYFHFIHFRPQVKTNDGAQVAQALDAESHHNGHQFIQHFDFHIQLVGAWM